MDWQDECRNDGALFVRPAMPIRIGYVRCSNHAQDLEARQKALLGLGVAENRICTDHGLTGTGRDRPGLAQVLAALREGDTLVVSKLDRLARSVPDARDIAKELERKGVTLALGTAVHDPSELMDRMFVNIVVTFAEFEADPSGCAPARAWRSPGPRESCGEEAETVRKAKERGLADA